MAILRVFPVAMMMIPVLLESSRASSTLIPTFNSETSGEIKVESGLVGSRYHRGDELLSQRELRNILSTEEACARRIVHDRRYRRIRSVTEVVGGVMLAYGLGASLIEKEFRGTPVGVGLAGLAFDMLCLGYFHRRNIRLAVDTFNRRGAGALTWPEPRYRLTITREFR